MKNLDNIKFEGAYIPLQKVKDDINALKGQKITLSEHNKTSKRLVGEYEGTVIETYNNIFLLEIQKGKLTSKRSFSYSDVSIGHLQITILIDK